MRSDRDKLKEIDIKGKRWADWGTREVAHFDYLYDSWITLAGGQYMLRGS